MTSPCWLASPAWNSVRTGHWRPASKPSATPAAVSAGLQAPALPLHKLQRAMAVRSKRKRLGGLDEAVKEALKNDMLGSDDEGGVGT